MLFSLMLLAVAPSEAPPVPLRAVIVQRPSVAVPPAPPLLPSDDLSEPGAPTGNPGTWVTNGDYPARAMRDRLEGTTGFRLSYDASGVPQTCDIVSSSGHADLDTATCTLTMERARFRPGKNLTGQAIGGTYSNRVRWTLPGPLANHFADGAMTVDFVVGTDGRARGCTVDQVGDPGGLPFSGVKACETIPQFAPFRDANGAAVERRVRLHMSVSVTDPGATAPQP